MAGHRNGNGKRSHSQDHEIGVGKRRNPGEVGPKDTVYRYLCSVTKIGCIIGRGGVVIQQLKADTGAMIRISETLLGSDERVVTIHSSSDETNDFDEMGDCVCPALDALFRVHDRVIAEDSGVDEEVEGNWTVTVRLLVPADQIGCVLGKGGQIVQTIRSETGAQVRILRDHLPICALSTDELLQISGASSVVKKALYQIAIRLHDNPSRTQHLLGSSVSSRAYPPPGSLVAPMGGAPIYAPMVGAYGGPQYSSRDESSLKEFSVRFVCPTANIGAVIGKGGSIINRIRQETRACIKVDSSSTEGDDCLITVSSKEYFDETISPTIEAARRLPARCSDKVERDSGIISFTTRLLVPNSCVGCLIGRGGAIINEMRNISKASIRVLPKDDLPKVAAEDDEMVQISGELHVVEMALIHVTSRLRANLFEKEGQVILPVLPYVPLSADVPKSSPYEGRDGGYSGGYGGSDDLPHTEPYGSYGGVQSDADESNDGHQGSYSAGRSSSSGLSGVSRRKHFGY